MTQPTNDALALPPVEPESTAAPSHTAPISRRARWFWAGAGLLAALSVAGLVVAWMAQQRVHQLELELVRRQQNSQSQSTEANVIAKQAEEQVRETAAKVALLEARVAEVALQRSQLEELIQSLSRSRDENILGDVEYNELRSQVLESGRFIFGPEVEAPPGADAQARVLAFIGRKP